MTRTGRRFSTPKIKAAEAAKGAQKRARTSRAGGELYVLRLVGRCSFAATPICKCQWAHSRSRKGRALPRWLQSIAWVGVGPCSTQHLSNIRSTAFIKREFMSKIGFARLSAEGSTIRR